MPSVLNLGKHYYLTPSAVNVGNLDATTVNYHADFINLQLYGSATPNAFIYAGFDENIFSYGVKLESGYQTAMQASHNSETYYRYNIFTCWHSNSAYRPLKNYLRCRYGVKNRLKMLIYHA